MIRPLKKPVNREQRSKSETVSAPVGGLNGRDNIASMAANEAFLMDNWFPGTISVTQRPGYTAWSTGLGGPVETVVGYEGGATQVLLGFANGSIFDCTAAGAVGAALASGRTNNRVQTCMFSNAGAQFLLGYNGADSPFSYNGAAIANLVITGVTGGQNTLATGTAFKGRMYVMNSQLGFYYLGVGAIQGAASYYDLSQIARKGGYVVAMGTYSYDAMNGPNDFAVFVTNLGEYIVYSGTDPSSAANWALVGRYYGPPPIGRKCFLNYGAELLVVTDEGVIPFSAIKNAGDEAANIGALTAVLGNTLLNLNAYNTVHGWCMVEYAHKGMLIVNAPGSTAESGPYYQFVMNTRTQKWCRFRNLNAIAWGQLNAQPYFGCYDGTVKRFDNGATSDAGAAILLDCKQAYNYFEDGQGLGQQNKHFHFVELLVGSNASPSLSASLNVDFVEEQPVYVATLGDAGSAWDTSTWDVDSWGFDSRTQTVLVPVGKMGVAASLWMRASVVGVTVEWYASRFIFEKAQGVLK